MGKKKSGPSKVSTSTTPQERKVAFKALKNEVTTHKKNGGMHPSPSINTLHRLEREGIVIWKSPITTIYYAFLESCHMLVEFLQALARRKLLLFLLSVATAALYYFYLTPGSHQPYFQFIEKKIVWWSWWVFLGILSSIGFGSGLHTFLLYLGPHIASVTLAAYECGSLNFPEPPYPEDIVCPDNGRGTAEITLWSIISKVRIESLLWGAGTALGELPPYFMARAARLSGEEPDDEEYKEFMALMNKGSNNQELSIWDRWKKRIELTVASVGFPGILLFASIPNPLFDLAGITCGHFLVPFWSFFGATLIGKAIVKMHLQMVTVIFAFSQHHVDHALKIIQQVPYVGVKIHEPFKDFLAKQRLALHRKPGSQHEVQDSSSWVQTGLQTLITGMILMFCLSLLNSLAQNYHKRIHSRV
ncbi:unnamed protein product, partial [Mesorhabditis belari]|uniref:Vacuole membrane protein 1 n=1 Tax=Mesorhabditis belari TaxID=2138241 RepID=A0AAF3EAI7_9BILA